MSKELIELVVQLYEKNWGVKDHGLARAVVALIRPATLEEAAKVADRYEIPMAETSASHIAAAIRALAQKETA